MLAQFHFLCREQRGRCRRAARRRLTTPEHWIIRAELAAHFLGLVPNLAALPFQRGVQLLRQCFKSRHIVTLEIDFEQFALELLTYRILDDGVLQDVFGLLVAPIGQIHLGLGNGIHLVGMDIAHTALTEIAQERCIAGGHLAAGVGHAGLHAGVARQAVAAQDTLRELA